MLIYGVKNALAYSEVTKKWYRLCADTAMECREDVAKKFIAEGIARYETPRAKKKVDNVDLIIGENISEE